MITKLHKVLEQTIPGLGFELVDVEITPTRTIVVYIDKPGGITIDDCETVSKHLNNLFLVEEIDYNRLEISSPGLERPLKKLDDFNRFCGSKAKIKTKELIDGQKVFLGMLKRTEGNNIHLEITQDNIMTIDFDNIYRAKLVFELKKGSSGKNKN